MAQIKDDNTDWGIGVLVAESEEGAYQPVATVATISEAREIAASDMRRRMHNLDQGKDSLCPFLYRVWARASSGEYAIVAEIESV